MNLKLTSIFGFANNASTISVWLVSTARVNADLLKKWILIILIYI